MAQNRLIYESSPYLLQHAHNPVDWYPWGQEALQKAKQENKPIFLSIGYSACHWCHVMEHESFENEEIAKIMNENFVCIKVDREERPDLDDIYQKACQLATGQGGWPLSVFLTPDQKPFYVGTYFPVLDSYGRPGFGSILRQLAQAWKEKPDEVKKAAENFVTNMQFVEIQQPAKLEKSILDEAAVNLFQIADTVFGGFGGAPKFPNSANLAFLLRYGRLSKITKFSEFVLKTLEKMARGGIFDQVGGGFHRYSTDARWLVPHFEKMLYDNALLPVLYAEAFQLTKNPFYLDVITKTLDFVLHEMTSPQGGFYSALDADSEGQEGKFYVWTKSQIQQILGKDAEIFCMYFDVTEGGNFEGRTILNNNISASQVASYFKISEDAVNKIVEEGTKKLLQARQDRIRPGLDDKILTAWNALMVSAFVKGYLVTQQKSYLDAATRCLEFIQKNMMSSEKLFRTYKDGKAKLNAYLEDYSYLVSAFIDVFGATAQPQYLEAAQRLANYMIAHFWDEQGGSFYFTADDHEQLIVRPKSNYDLSMPSGNSVAANCLLKLYHLTLQKNYLDIAVRIMESFALAAAENPFGFGHLLCTIYMYLQGVVEITIVNNFGDAYEYLTGKFLPESIIVIVPSAEKLSQLSKYQFFSGKEFFDKATVYVCKNFSCSLPTQKIDEIEKLLG